VVKKYSDQKALCDDDINEHVAQRSPAPDRGADDGEEHAIAGNAWEPIILEGTDKGRAYSKKSTNQIAAGCILKFAFAVDISPDYLGKQQRGCIRQSRIVDRRRSETCVNQVIDWRRITTTKVAAAGIRWTRRNPRIISQTTADSMAKTIIVLRASTSTDQAKTNNGM
jgi:hypothetical protein